MTWPVTADRLDPPLAWPWQSQRRASPCRSSSPERPRLLPAPRSFASRSPTAPPARPSFGTRACQPTGPPSFDDRAPLQRARTGLTGAAAPYTRPTPPRQGSAQYRVYGQARGIRRRAGGKGSLPRRMPRRPGNYRLQAPACRSSGKTRSSSSIATSWEISPRTLRRPSARTALRSSTASRTTCSGPGAVVRPSPGSSHGARCRSAEPSAAYRRRAGITGMHVDGSKPPLVEPVQQFFQ